jgi:SAM-dependent methyltransferase
MSAKGRILDVGCYIGTFLHYLQTHGWDVTGVELDPSAVRFARERFGLEILNCPLESLDNAKYCQGFDVVTMLHVIEHLDDPSSTLSVALRLLKPRGVFVIETPTYDSLTFKLLGRRERSISCNGHIFFYTSETLWKLLEKTGFEIIEWRKVGRTLSLGRLIWNLGVISKNITIQQVVERVISKYTLDRNGLRIYLNTRDMIRLYCRPK